MSEQDNRTLAVLDEVIREVERLLRDSSAIGLDRARLSMILSNCRRVRVALAPLPAASSDHAGDAGPEDTGPPDGPDRAGAPRA
jgi:hypothetical protein